MSAVVASHEVHVLVQSERHVAVLTFRHPSTFLTLHNGHEAPSVLEKYYLPVVLERFPHGFQQLRRERPPHHLSPLHVLYVYSLYLRQCHVLVSSVEPNISVFAVPCVRHAFHAWSGRAEQSLCSIHCGKHYGHAACVVAGTGVLLFVACLMFLVYYHQSEVAERQQCRAPCPNNNVVWTLRHLLFPYLHPLGIAVSAVVYAESVAKHPLQPFHHLYGKSYLGQQEQHLLVLAEGLQHEVYVYLGLPARCHTVQQHHVLLQESHQYAVVCILLGLVKLLGVLWCE